MRSVRRAPGRASCSRFCSRRLAWWLPWLLCFYCLTRLLLGDSIARRTELEARMFDCRPTKIALTLLVLASSARIAFIRLDVQVPNATLTESRAQQRGES